MGIDTPKSSLKKAKANYKNEAIKEITINRRNRNQLENKTRRIPLLQSNTSRIARINEETTKNSHYSNLRHGEQPAKKELTIRNPLHKMKPEQETGVKSESLDLKWCSR